MNVNPTQPDPTSRPGTGRLRRSTSEVILRPVDRRSAESAGSVESLGPQQDAVEISAAAREITSFLETADRGDLGLTPERQREILDRIAQGFYQRTDVRDEVLRRLAADLDTDAR
jgi:hypothetical protein